MNGALARSTTRALVAVALLGYGLYRALWVPGLMAGPPAPLLLVCFVLQALSAIAAGIGILLRAPWATAAVLLLGVSIAATAVVEGFVLGIAPYLRSLLEAVLAVVVALVLAAWILRPPAA